LIENEIVILTMSYEIKFLFIDYHSEVKRDQDKALIILVKPVRVINRSIYNSVSYKY